MITKADLDAYLGKNIKDICQNHFDDASLNHCAHFVSHALRLSFSFNCGQMTGGTDPAANIRVHEVFARCPRVGKWGDADASQIQLVFVTRKDVVNLSTKTMQNIPQKHVGIFCDGLVYNYSNGTDQVVRVPVDEFYERFQGIYAGDQGLFFGEIPGSELLLSVDRAGSTVNRGIAFALSKQGKKWSAQRIDSLQEPKFYVGSETIDPAKGFYGLFQPGSAYYGPRYKAVDHVSQIDHWAYLLDVTAYCESNLYINLINTYDRARFTFGFYQLAAHTPRDNLILFFRAALAEPEFQELFPDLALRGGRVFRVAEDGTETDLEKETFDPVSGEDQLQAFMEYMNPTRKQIDEQEILQSARLVWWANTSKKCAEIQANVSASILQKKMASRYAAWYDLDGESDIVCAIIADIHHQGRGKKADVRNALATANKVNALLQIGKVDYSTRVQALTERIEKWKADGIMGVKRYRPATNEFE